MRLVIKMKLMIVVGVLVIVSLVGGRRADSLNDDDDDDKEEQQKKDNNQIHDLFTCCSMVFGSCRSSCEELPLAQMATVDYNYRDSKLNDIRRYCPLAKVDFWTCMNGTLDAVSHGSQWPGRRCCTMGLLPRCRAICATSASVEEMKHGCRQSDEVNLFSCIERQVKAEKCCSNARTNECLQFCRDTFEHRSYPLMEFYDASNVEEICDANGGDNEVLQCLRKFTDFTPVADAHKYLPCCDHTKSKECLLSCRYILNVPGATEDMIINTMEQGGCGPPLPYEPLWQCFLSPGQDVYIPTNSGEVSQINQVGMDSAKLHCCHKAIAPKCRRLCLQTFFNDWTETRKEFEADCLMQVNELALRQCIDEVEEPCEMGCDGLSYCTNFNNRPTELFRSCMVHADMAARADVAMWQQMGKLSLPQLNIPLKNISKCSPERWQAIACTLQIKPCTKTRHMNQICREDCYRILSDCMDWTKLELGVTAASICSKLSPEDEDVPCISLKPYMEPSDVPTHTGGHHDLTSPCKGHPCNESEVCLPFRNGSIGFQCTPGCPLGEASSYWVPFGAYVRVPVSSVDQVCLKICRCGANGKIDHCQPVPCFNYLHCVIGDRRIDHASWFYIECNICSCFASEITCTKKQCKIPGLSDQSYTSLPCNCPAHYVPVCGKNGNTYHSACIAKCTGLQDHEIEFGACISQPDPCTDGLHHCPVGTRCIPERQVCLSVMQRPCKQYQCVNVTLLCSSREPACDTTGITHSTVCHLLASQAKLFHFGACFQACSMKGQICGINGVTYNSECLAWSDYSIMDYPGVCRQVGLLAADMGPRCKHVECDRLPSKYCQPTVPPGACCPICSGAFRIVYSRKQVDRALYSLKGKHLEAVTLKSILRELDSLVQITECQLVGFLTMEADIFVAVLSREKSPTQVQIEACTGEATKIANLISTQSHKVTTNLALSALTVANMIGPVAESSGVRWSYFVWLILLSALLTGSNRLANR